MVTVYFRDQSVQVTSDAVRVDGTSYSVAALQLVWHRRGPATTRTMSRRFGRGVLILVISILPLAAIVCAISLVYSATDRSAWGLAIVVLAVGVIGALVLAPFARLIKDRKLHGYQYDQFWCMDTFKEQQQLTDLYNSGCAPWQVWKGEPVGGPTR